MIEKTLKGTYWRSARYSGVDQKPFVIIAEDELDISIRQLDNGRYGGMRKENLTTFYQPMSKSEVIKWKLRV